jgi:hypothetical protein
LNALYAATRIAAVWVRGVTEPSRVLKTEGEFSRHHNLLAGAIQKSVNSELFEVIMAMTGVPNKQWIILRPAHDQVAGANVSDCAGKIKQAAGAGQSASFADFAAARTERSIIDVGLHGGLIQHQVGKSGLELQNQHSKQKKRSALSCQQASCPMWKHNQLKRNVTKYYPHYRLTVYAGATIQAIR